MTLERAKPQRTGSLFRDKKSKKRGQIYFSMLVDARINKSAPFSRKLQLQQGLQKHSRVNVLLEFQSNNSFKSLNTLTGTV